MLTTIPSSAATLSDAVWIDLLTPTDQERAEVERVTELRLPTQAEIDEIEWSSRVFVENGALYLSTPVPAAAEGMSETSPTLGFVLSSQWLVTLRFAPITVVDRLVAHCAKAPAKGAGDAFLLILEAIVDHAADSLERAGAELDRISSSAFRSETPHTARMASASAALHGVLRKLGRMDGGLSHVRDALLGVDRISAFTLEGNGQQGLVESGPRLGSIRADIASLKDYQAHLAGKVQFLLDATLGFISIQQNEIVKALTIVSVVGVPPVLIAGIYGMNFRFMPELSWAYGYPFAIGLIVVSALVPLIGFKWRGWL
jgi:magnesium transporter